MGHLWRIASKISSDAPQVAGEKNEAAGTVNQPGNVGQKQDSEQKQRLSSLPVDQGTRQHL